MAVVGSFSYGSASAYWYSTIQEVLGQLPDNTGQLIQASDIRDAVYSVWAELQVVSSIASSASVANSGTLYSNTNLVPYAVGGVTAGASFPATYSFQQMFDRLLYPVVLPGIVMNTISDREFGSSINLSLGWTISVNTYPVASITVNSVPKTFPPYSGFQSATGTYSLSTSLYQTNTFNMSVVDTNFNTSTSSTTLTWKHRRYWGKYNFGNVNLTINPASASYVASLLSDSNLLSMLSGNANGSAANSELSISKSKSYNNMDGSGSHLVFAWPSVFDGATNPIFYVNGLINNAFTNIKTSYIFTNQYGYTASYEVWISNTIYNSPVNIQIT